jgi:hypothetical protein
MSLLAQFLPNRRGWGYKESLSMCDYSLQTVRSRPAEVGETLKTQHFKAPNSAPDQLDQTHR